MKQAIAATLAALTLFAVCPPALAIEVTWKDHARTYSLSDETGHYVLLHFWASWCKPCRDEMPELDAWTKAHPNIMFIPISLDKDAAHAARFLKSNELGDVPVLMGNLNEPRRLGLRGLPATLLIDPKGHVIRTMLGPRPWGADTFSQSVLQTLNSHGQKAKD